jgi:hypothetical protein
MMQAVPSPLEGGSQTAPPPRKLNCVIVYEDRSAGERGERFYQQLTSVMEADGEMTHHLWSFPVLAIPQVRNIAASAAAAADIVVFALSGKKRLPEKVQEWVDMWIWLIDRANPTLVALFENPNSECRLICNYLRSVAAGKQLNFFPHGAAPLPALSFPVRKMGVPSLINRSWKREEASAHASL